MATLLAGFRRLRDIVEGASLTPIRGEERHTAGLSSDADLIQALRARADTVYHPVGSCRMGQDDQAVCDPRLKVHGIDNLWIADASVMPSIVSGNTHAAAVMIGERAADFIRTESRTSPSDRRSGTPFRTDATSATETFAAQPSFKKLLNINYELPLDWFTRPF